MKRALCLITLSAICLASGCYSQTYISKSATPSTAKTDRNMSFFFLGLVGTAQISVPEICAGRTASRIVTKQTFVDIVLAVITLGIYVPRTATISCSQ